MPTIDIFAQRIKEVIEDEGVLQTQMTEDGVICKPALSCYKTGVHYPGVFNLMAICEYLNVSADYLLGLTDEKRRLW